MSEEAWEKVLCHSLSVMDKERKLAAKNQGPLARAWNTWRYKMAHGMVQVARWHLHKKRLARQVSSDRVDGLKGGTDGSEIG
jgi:hypothetical protein